MTKSVSIYNNDYYWLVDESSKESIKQKKKVSIAEIISSLIKQWSK